MKYIEIKPQPRIRVRVRMHSDYKSVAFSLTKTSDTIHKSCDYFDKIKDAVERDGKYYWEVEE